jgi:hypothetical protein
MRPLSRLPILGGALAAAILVPLLPAGTSGVDRDPKAVEVAERTMDAMGGRKAYEAVRTLRFRFVVERDGKELGSRSHVWDRWDGRYRLEATTREGKPLLVLMNLNDRTGDAWVDGEKVDPDSAALYLGQAYGSFINDSYWLLMPWKWLDPGVDLTYEGKKTVDGADYDVVHLAFVNGTGLTSNDQYWGYVSRKTGLMERWDYLLQDDQGNPGTGARSTFLWEHWEPVEGSGILLARDKVLAGTSPETAIRFPVVTASAGPDSAAFRPPGP